MDLDTLQYVAVNAHVSGNTGLWNTDLWKSNSKNTPAPVYSPIDYNRRIMPANLFYKNMLLRRQRVLFLSSIDNNLKITGPFSHLFLTSIWIGGILTNYRKVQYNIRYFGSFLDILNYLESTQKIRLGLKKLYIEKMPQINKPVTPLIWSSLALEIEENCTLLLNYFPDFNPIVDIPLKRIQNKYNLQTDIVHKNEYALQKLILSFLFNIHFFQIAYSIVSNTLNNQLKKENNLQNITLFFNAYIQHPIINYSFYIPVILFADFYIILLYKQLACCNSLLLLYQNLFKFSKSPQRRLKRNFPSINIATRLTFSEYVIF
jgi:hypothetical protein